VFFAATRGTINRCISYVISAYQFVRNLCFCCRRDLNLKQTPAHKDSWVFSDTLVPPQPISMPIMINPNQQEKENYD
jgi:hypothetical protein